MRNISTVRKAFTFTFSAVLFVGIRGYAQQKPAAPEHMEHMHHMQTTKTTAPVPAPVVTKAPTIPDVVVMDQDNHKLHFYRDLVQGKTVAINFIFTTCTTICPPLTANFARIQKTLLQQGKKDLHLISVSVDPENDTPERLKNYAAMFHAQPGWTFVTGDRADMEKIWKAFNIYIGSKQDHPPTVAIGNDEQRTWTYASGLTSADKLMSVITPMLANKETDKTASAGAAKEHDSESR